MYLLQSKLVLFIENFVICSYIATKFLTNSFLSVFWDFFLAKRSCNVCTLAWKMIDDIVVSSALLQDGLAEVCVGRDIAGGDIVSTTARGASSVEIDAPSDNSSLKG